MNYFVLHEKSCEIHIDIVTSFKEDFPNPVDFMVAAVHFLDEKIFPGEEILADYDGVVLKAGKYAEIVNEQIRAMDQTIDIDIGEVQQSFRIKFPKYEPFRYEIIMVTSDKYIMFAWSTSE